MKKPDARPEGAGGEKRRGKVDGADVGFTAFWNVFPKRVEEGAALKAFIVAVERGVDPETLIAGARRYAVERTGRECGLHQASGDLAQ